MVKRQKIIVTGANGFVGKRLVPLLTKKFGPKNILLLVWNKEKIENNFNCKVKKVDLVTKNGLSKLPKADIIIHLAANTNTSDPDHRVNDQGVANLYEALFPLKPNAHFIHISTMVNVAGRPNCKSTINENSQDYPTNEYTRTKLNGEKYLLKKCMEDNFKLTVIRPNTIYGKNPRPNSLFDMLKNYINKKSIITKINWPGKSALIHVDDVAKIIFKFTQIKPISGVPEKYLIYSENLSISEISKIMHQKMNIKYEPLLIPQSIWSVAKYMRRFVPFFEKLMPQNIYNVFWRLSIIVDDVIYPSSNKAVAKLKITNFKKLKDTVSEVI